MALATKSQLLELAQEIQELTGQLVAHLSDAGKKEPNFTAESTEVPSDDDYNALRDRLCDATADLEQLVKGPKTHLRDYFSTHHELAAFQVAFDFEFFTAFPRDGSIEIGELAQRTGLDEELIPRVMRLLCLHHIFEEVSEGRYTHTHGSITLAENEGLRAAATYQLDEYFQAASHLAPSLRATISQSPDEPKVTAFRSAYGVSLFEFYARHPERGARFARAMIGVSQLNNDFNQLLGCYTWDSLGAKAIVDVGGGNGHMSVALAKVLKYARFVIQDANEGMLNQGEMSTGQDLKNRITFMRHDFFTPQPIFGDVGAYLLRQITHNWADEDVIKIFKELAHALENCDPSTPLLINELIIPEPGSRSRFEERIGRQMDIMMLVALGARQRSRAQFQTLLMKADPRLKITKVHDGIPMGILEVHLARG